MTEAYYQRYLQKYLGGKHMQLKIGQTDITTEAFHAEIKEWSNWKNAVGQLQVYCYVEYREELRLYLFGTSNKKFKNDYVNIIIGLNIKPYELIKTETGIDIIDLETNIKLDSILENEQDEKNVIKLINKINEQDENQIIDMFNKLLNISIDDKFNINLDDVSKLLNCNKCELISTLRRSYTKNIDYTIKNDVNPNYSKGIKTSNNYKKVMITHDTFKRLIMSSNAKNADIARKYI